MYENESLVSETWKWTVTAHVPSESTQHSQHFLLVCFTYFLFWLTQHSRHFLGFELTMTKNVLVLFKTFFFTPLCEHVIIWLVNNLIINRLIFKQHLQIFLLFSVSYCKLNIFSSYLEETWNMKTSPWPNMCIFQIFWPFLYLINSKLSSRILRD